MAESPENKFRIYCNHCRLETNHELKGKHEAIFGLGPLEYGESYTYKLWICMGCEHGVLEQIYSNEDMPDDVHFHEFFPYRTRGFLFPKPYSKLKPKLAAIYRESLTCYNASALRLCVAGLRALLEGVCQDKRVKGKNLKVKIEGLQTLLPNKNIVKNLHHFRFMGNEAVHELDAPNETELSLAIEVIQDLLNFLYELDYKASQLRDMRKTKKARSRKAAKAPAAPSPSSVI